MNPADVRWLAEKVVAEAFYSVSNEAVLALAKRVLELEQPVAHEHSPVLVERPVDGVFKVGDRVRHKYAPTSCVGVVVDTRDLECRVRVDAMPNVSQPDERWISNYNLEHVPVMHVDPAAPGSDRTVAVLHVPVDERKVAEAYREKVLEAFRAWDMRPNDRRTWHQVVMEVDLP